MPSSHQFQTVRHYRHHLLHHHRLLHKAGMVGMGDMAVAGAVVGTVAGTALAPEPEDMEVGLCC